MPDNCVSLAAAAPSAAAISAREAPGTPIKSFVFYECPTAPADGVGNTHDLCARRGAGTVCFRR